MLPGVQFPRLPYTGGSTDTMFGSRTSINSPELVGKLTALHNNIQTKRLLICTSANRVYLHYAVNYFMERTCPAKTAWCKKCML